MKLSTRESNRWCVVEYDERPSAAKLRKQILREENVVSGFSILTAPAPAYDDTSFKVCGNEKEILVAVCLLDSVHPSQSGDRGPADTVEVLFDPLNDQIGYEQFLLDPSMKEAAPGTNPHRDPEHVGEVQVISHRPYPEAHSSAYPGVKLKRHEWRDERFSAYSIAPLRCRWLFAWFYTEQIFRNGPVCGFNVCRNRPYLAEYSSWNYCGGNGAQDATGFGRLYRIKAPAHVTQVSARLNGQALSIEGELDGLAGELGMELVTPCGDRRPLRLSVSGSTWKGQARLGAVEGGRYRFCPRFAGGPVEPAYLSVDVPSRSKAQDFCLSVTYDPPMSIIANCYTPDRLARDMEIWADLGVNRVHWIEYGDWPSFWKYPPPGWAENYARTVRECGDFLASAVEAAHRHDLELIADLKTFDLGFNCFFADGDGVSTVEDLEKEHACVIPEIAAHHEWTMRANPAWEREPSLPVSRLRLYSEKPIPELSRSEVRLLTSEDNVRFRRYRKSFDWQQGTLRRPHMRWTPAGNVKEKSGRKNWYVEFSGLRVDKPFLAVQLGKGAFQLWHRGYMLAEAWNASGESVPLTLATNGNSEGGFYFWKGWPGWTNQTEAILQERQWDGRDLGIAFREMPNMPTMLEPAYEGARKIWLERIGRILGGGADGVDIRTYCHHNGPMSYLKYAFAQPVRETFQSRYGREPRADPQDYERIRRIRGDFYTEFLRTAKRMVSQRSKKLVVELESGIEVPATLDCRMQLPMDWRTWIREGVLDEIRLKWWTAESTFVHEEVLPLARKHDIPVHIISRCLHEGLTARAVELAERVVGGACSAGFSGYSFYEHQNLMDMNSEGRSTLKGPVRAYFEKAREVLYR